MWKCWNWSCHLFHFKSWQENGKIYKLEWEIFFVVVDFANVFGANLHIWSAMNSVSKIFIFLRSNISLCGIGIIYVVLRYLVCSPFVSVVPSCIDPRFWIALNMRLPFVNEWRIFMIGIIKQIKPDKFFLSS